MHVKWGNNSFAICLGTVTVSNVHCPNVKTCQGEGPVGSLCQKIHLYQLLVSVFYSSNRFSNCRNDRNLSHE